MSVINTMLKDLERRQQPSVADELPVPELQYQQVPPSKLPWILLCLTLVILLVGGGFAWQKVELLTHDNQQLSEQFAQNSELGISVATDNSINEAEKAVVEDVPQTAANIDESVVEREPVVEPEVAEQGVDQESSVEQVVTETAVVTEQPQVTAPIKSDVVENGSIKIEAVRTESVVKETAVKEQTPKASSVKASSGSMAVTEVKLSPKELAQKRFDAGKALQDAGQMKQAQNNFSEALKFYPAMHQARQHLAAVYYGQDMLSEVESVLQQGLSLYPQEYDYALLLAKLYQSANLTDKALQSLAKIPDTHKLAKEKWTMQSYLAQQTEKFSLAEQSYRYLVGIEPEQARWWMGLAYALDSQSQFSAAKQAYQQALKLKGLSSQASAFIEERLTQLGDIQ